MSASAQRRFAAVVAGLLSIFDLSGVATYDALRRVQGEQDHEVRSDWQNVGHDLSMVMSRHQESPES